MSDKFVGKRLDGRYEIHELIGTGGMAYVYKAFDNMSQRWVAVKILKEELSTNSEFLRRFRNESRAIAVLSHPNIVKVVDVSFGDKLQYIVMEYIDGITLKEYINRKGIVPLREGIYFTVQILKALEHAHENGIIHRDVKPQNIILLQDGTIKVTDFGIARFSQSETQTMTGKALGSVHYIAPEQARGEFTNDKADIYSLGVMMYEMFTGQLPFEADSAVSVALMQLQSEAQMPRSVNPQIPAALEEITMKAMQKSTSLRFSSATEMLRDIEKFRQNPNIVFGYSFNQDIHSTIEMDIYPAKKVETQEYHDNYEYEEELVKSKRQAKGSMVITGVIAAIIVAVIAIVVIFALDFVKGMNDDDKITDEVLLVNFVGMNYETEIKNNDEYSNLYFEIEHITDLEKEDGIVTRQTPSAGINVKIGKTIKLYVNFLGNVEEEIPVPAVAGESQTTAFNMIQNAGFVPVIKTQADDDTAVDYVISTAPAAGETAVPGSEVIIYVSNGPAEVPVEIPNLTGESLSDAKALLELAGLELGKVEYDEESEEEKDIVTETSPKVGSIVEEGSKVNLTLSAGTKTDKNVTINFPLPSGVNYDIKVKVYVNGVLVNEATVNPSYQTSYTTTVTGKTGTEGVAVKLDGQEYVFGQVDYDKQTFDVDTIFVFVTPTPVPTAEPTPVPTPEPTPEPTPIPVAPEGE